MNVGICVRQDKGFGALLIGVDDGKYAWVEPIILDNMLCFPEVPRVYDFAPETSETYDSPEAAVEAARNAGATQVMDCIYRGMALQFLDELGLLMKGSRGDRQFQGEEFWQTIFCYGI